MRYFSDCHFHVMTLQEPNFASFISSLYDSAGNIISANTSFDYILTPELMKGENFLNMVTNTLMAFNRPIGETLQMMEDDLMGRFTAGQERDYAPPLPYIHGGKMHFRSMEFDRMLMIPLIMDFSEDQRMMKRIYYRYPAADRITPYTEAMVEGMRDYYRARPDGLFEFYPFLGIDPRLHTMEFMEKLLDRYINTSHVMHKPHEVPSKPCYGIKIYPPLGFRPWPNDSATLEKHRKLYAFCQDRRIPIITHADDQGFRGVNAEEAWAYTDPAAWRTVLENYPGLIIDFAHAGKQYAIASRSNLQSIAARLRHHPDSPWFYSIMQLMDEFDGVYTDVSFSGCTPEFYTELLAYIGEQKAGRREKLMSRILFGSDFSVNLFKVESYTEYYSVFERSGFTDEDIARIAERNAISFLGLSEAPLPKIRGRHPLQIPKRT